MASVLKNYISAPEALTEEIELVHYLLTESHVKQLRQCGRRTLEDESILLNFYAGMSEWMHTFASDPSRMTEDQLNVARVLIDQYGKCLDTVDRNMVKFPDGPSLDMSGNLGFVYNIALHLRFEESCQFCEILQYMVKMYPEEMFVIAENHPDTTIWLMKKFMNSCDDRCTIVFEFLRSLPRIMHKTCGDFRFLNLICAAIVRYQSKHRELALIMLEGLLLTDRRLVISLVTEHRLISKLEVVLRHESCPFETFCALLRCISILTKFRNEFDSSYWTDELEAFMTGILLGFPVNHPPVTGMYIPSFRIFYRLYLPALDLKTPLALHMIEHAFRIGANALDNSQLRGCALKIILDVVRKDPKFVDSALGMASVVSGLCYNLQGLDYAPCIPVYKLACVLAEASEHVRTIFGMALLPKYVLEFLCKPAAKIKVNFTPESLPIAKECGIELMAIMSVNAQVRTAMLSIPESLKQFLTWAFDASTHSKHWALLLCRNFAEAATQGEFSKTPLHVLMMTYLNVFYSKDPVYRALECVFETPETNYTRDDQNLGNATTFLTHVHNQLWQSLLDLEKQKKRFAIGGLKGDTKRLEADWQKAYASIEGMRVARVPLLDLVAPEPPQENLKHMAIDELMFETQTRHKPNLLLNLSDSSHAVRVYAEPQEEGAWEMFKTLIQNGFVDTFPRGSLAPPEDLLTILSNFGIQESKSLAIRGTKIYYLDWKENLFEMVFMTDASANKMIRMTPSKRPTEWKSAHPRLQTWLTRYQEHPFVHRRVLVMRSEYFAQKFSGQYADSNLAEYAFDGDCEVLMLVVMYLYAGTDVYMQLLNEMLRMDEKLCLRLLRCADFYGLEYLKARCEWCMLKCAWEFRDESPKALRHISRISTDLNDNVGAPILRLGMRTLDATYHM